MAAKGNGNTTITFNANALTNYANQADMSATLNDIDTTHFGSTSRESIADVEEWSVSLGGDWDATLDGYLAPEAITTGTKRTAVVAYTDDASGTATYTWTSNAEISDYTITSEAVGKVAWTATLRLSGAPARVAS